MESTLWNKVLRLLSALGLCALMAGGCSLPQKITLSLSDDRQPLNKDTGGLVVTKQSVAAEPPAVPRQQEFQEPAAIPPTEPGWTESPATDFLATTFLFFSLLDQTRINHRTDRVDPTNRLTLLDASLFVNLEEKPAKGSPSAGGEKQENLVVYDTFFEVVEEGPEDRGEWFRDNAPEPVEGKPNLVLHAGDFVFRARLKGLKVTFSWPILSDPSIMTHFRLEPKQIMWWINMDW